MIDISVGDATSERKQALQQFAAAFRLAAHVLLRDPQQLIGQMFGRLSETTSAEIQQILQNGAAKKDTPWLRSLIPSLTQPGGPLIRLLEGHTDSIIALATTPDGKKIISCSRDATINVWNLQSGELLHSLKVSQKRFDEDISYQILKAKISSDGKRIICQNQGMTVKLLDLQAGVELGSVWRPREQILGWIALIPDKSIAISRSRPSYERDSYTVWDLERGRKLYALNVHTKDISVLMVPHNVNHAISASWDMTLKIWDLQSGEILKVLDNIDATPDNMLAVTPDGRCLVTCNKRTLKVWDLLDGIKLHTIELNQSGISNLMLSPDGMRIIAVRGMASLSVWDVKSGNELYTVGGHTEEFSAVSVTPDGTKIIAGSRDATIKVWDLQKGEELHSVIDQSGGSINGLAISPDGKCIVSSSNNTLKVWKIPMTKKEIQPQRSQQSHARGIDSIATTPFGNLAITGSMDTSLKVWNIQSGELLYTLQGHTGGVQGVIVTPDGKRVISRSEDISLRVWTLDDGQESQVLDGHAGYIDNFVLTSDGSLVISGSMDGFLKVWDLESGKTLQTLEDHTKGVTALALSPDDTRVISGSYGNPLIVWDLRSGKRLRELKHTMRLINHVDVTPDGKHFISTSYNEVILNIWDLERGILLYTLSGHQEEISSFAVTPDSKRLLSGSVDGVLNIWDIQTGDLLQTLKGHLGRILKIVCTPDGQHAITISGDRTLKIWNLNSGLEEAAHNFDASIWSVSRATDGLTLVAGDTGGQIHFLHLENVIPGAYIVSARHNMSRGFRIQCPLCGKSFEIGPSDLGREISSRCCNVKLRLNPFSIEMPETDAFATLATRGEPDIRHVKITLINQVDIPTGEITAITFNVVRDQVITASTDSNYITIWNLESGKQLLTCEGHQGNVYALSVTPDGRSLISGSADKTLRVWDLQSGKLIHIMTECPEVVSTLKISPDGLHAVSIYSGRMFVWDLLMRKLLFNRFLNATEFTITPDSRCIIVAVSDGDLQIYELHNVKHLHTLRGHQESIERLTVTPDNQLLLAGSADNSIHIWNLKSEQSIRRLKCRGGYIQLLTVTPDGQFPISINNDFTGGDNTLRLWDIKTGTATTYSHERGIYQCVFSRDGRKLISIDRTGHVCVLNLENYMPGALIITAVDHDEGLRVCCPSCQTHHPIIQTQLGSELTCPTPGCGLRLMINPFVIHMA